MIGKDYFINEPTNTDPILYSTVYSVEVQDGIVYGLVSPKTNEVEGTVISRYPNLFHVVVAPTDEMSSSSNVKPGHVLWAKHPYVAVEVNDPCVVRYLVRQDEARLNITLFGSKVIASHHKELLLDDVIESIEGCQVVLGCVSFQDAAKIAGEHHLMIGKSPIEDKIISFVPQIPLNRLLLPETVLLKITRGTDTFDVKVRCKPALCSLQHKMDVIDFEYLIATGLSPIFDYEVVESLTNHFGCLNLYYIAACTQNYLYPGAGAQVLLADGKPISNTDDIETARTLTCIYPNGEQLLLDKGYQGLV